MSVANGQPANQDTFNNAFVSKSSDSTITGQVTLNKPSSGGTITNLQQEVNNKLNSSEVGAPNGVAELDGSGKVPAAQLPSYVDDVLEYANLAAFPVSGETGKLYLAIDTGKLYRWTGSVYVEVSNGVDLTSVNSNILPDTDNTRNLGSSVKRWAEAHHITTFTDSIESENGNDLLISSDTGNAILDLGAVLPIVDNATSLGSTTERFSDIHSINSLTNTIGSEAGNDLTIQTDTGIINTNASDIIPDTNNNLEMGSTSAQLLNVYSGKVQATGQPLNLRGDNVNIQPFSSDPSGADGDLYYNTTSKKYRYYDGGSATWKDVSAAAGAYTDPLVTKYTSGSGTHTFTGTPLYVEIEMVGGGGGGGGSGQSATAGNGADGTDTTFSTATASKGLGGGGGGVAGVGTGGAATLGPGVGTNLSGGDGSGGGYSSGTTVAHSGGVGGSNGRGGAGSGGGVNGTGGAGVAGTGAGGGGAGGGTFSSMYAGNGGGGGGYSKFIIYSPAASYSYGVGTGGAAGTAGTNGFAGGAGARGEIIIREFYQ